MPKAKASKLPIKRQKYVEALVGIANGNKTEAARIAGYMVPAQEGHRLLKFADVAQAVAERLEKVKRRMNADGVRARLELMAEGRIPTKVIRGMTPKGPMRRVEYDSEHATETLAKIEGMLSDGMPPAVQAINVNVVLPQVPEEVLWKLREVLSKAKATDIVARVE